MKSAFLATLFLTTAISVSTWASDEVSNIDKKAGPIHEKTSSNHLFGFHATLAIPHPTSVGLDYHLNSQFSFSASVGSFRDRIDHTDIGIFNTEVTARWHMFSGGFFLGSHFGRQKMTGERTRQIQAETVTAKAEYEGTYYTPHIGWLFADRPGFTLGAEFGYMIPSGSNITISSNASAGSQASGEYAELVRQTKKMINDTIDNGFPHIAVIRLGWVF